MFVRSETDQRRVVIIDVTHLFYKYAFNSFFQKQSQIF